ncbi:uncharacterized protein LOC134088133 [Sardina pilchardus]|uniref:uncharacterized protein LOC134088133 n=1 Tax=Sardina pilchardus TaxID=27697 RepID=UPI002E0F027C
MFLLYVAVFLTVLSTVPCSSQQSAPTYPWEDAETREAVTCEKCPPGTYVGSHCSKHQRTVCRPCAESQYTEYWNYVEECLLCDYPCSEVQEEVQGCNRTHNRVCRCKEGYYNTLDFCLKHSVCSPGEGVKIADVKVCCQEAVRLVRAERQNLRVLRNMRRANWNRTERSFTYLRPISGAVHNHTMAWEAIESGSSISIEGNLKYNRIQRMLTVTRAGKYFVHLTLHFTRTALDSVSSRVNVMLKSATVVLLSCEVELPSGGQCVMPVTRSCWGMVPSMKRGSRLSAQMIVQTDRVFGWKLVSNESGFWIVNGL